MKETESSIPEAIRVACRGGKYEGVVEALRPIAESGNAEAQYLLARALEDQSGASDAEYCEWVRRSALGGWAEAQEALGRIFEYGACGVSCDPGEAARWYEIALENGYDPSHYLADRIAAFYRDGVGVEPDWGRAFTLFERAIRNGGYSHAYPDLAWCHFWGLGTPRNPRRAAETYVELQKVFLTRACSLSLAALHALGLGVERSPKLVVEHLHAVMSDNFAGMLLGKCYLTGYGVAADQARGMQLLQSANETMASPIEIGLEQAGEELWSMWLDAWLDDPAAQVALVNFDRAHMGRSRSPVERREPNRWLRRAAWSGNAEAQFEFGQLFRSKGQGVPRDAKVATAWLRKSAAQGYVPAQEELASMCGNDS